jgi:imidazolonepropionase-like amidohydrolase
VVPTLHLWENRYLPLNVDSLLALPEMAYVPSYLKDGWVRETERRAVVPEETARLMVDVRRRLLRAITVAGVGVVLSSGSPEMFHVPGFAVRHEMESMRAAGLTPYEVLVTATRNVAEYARRELRESGNFGRVFEGNRADLLLLRGNPLRDLDRLWDQAGVMVRGRWMSRDEIDAGLARLAEKYGEPGA